MAMEGEIPSIVSTSGFSIMPRNCLAYAESDSTYRRCPSAKSVSNASDDFPDPDTPVITTSLPRGISTSIFRRLCTLAPRMRITSPVGFDDDALLMIRIFVSFVFVVLGTKCSIISMCQDPRKKSGRFRFRGLPENLEERCIAHRRSLASISSGAPLDELEVNGRSSTSAKPLIFAAACDRILRPPWISPPQNAPFFAERNASLGEQPPMISRRLLKRRGLSKRAGRNTTFYFAMTKTTFSSGSRKKHCREFS